MTYMRCSVSLVKGVLLRCIINKSFTFFGEMSAPKSPEFGRLTFPKCRYFKLDSDFALRAGEQFGLMFPYG
jgi:hypothetical protein